MRDFFFYLFTFFCFCPDFEPSLGLFVFIFNVFFPLLAGIPETVLAVVTYILKWHKLHRN